MTAEPQSAPPPQPAGDPLGTHRVLEPRGAMPQPAWKLDNDADRAYATEIVVDVELLNIDAASFRQMLEASGSPEGVGGKVLETVAERGKQHNPVTGSGGMLLGRVARVGALAEGRGVRPGDRIATLASLSLTPLSVSAVRSVRPTSAQLEVEGRAVIFGSAPFARMPDDFDDKVAVALFDVAGAAPQAARLVASGDRVLVLGAGGKSGLLCAAQARRSAGPAGRVVGAESHAPYADEARALGLFDAVCVADARDPLALTRALGDELGPGFDVVFSCVNVEGAEMAAVVCVRPRGKVYFFAMTTSFARAALGAEGIGKDADLYIGNGYAEGHADFSLALLRSEPKLRALFERRYG
ncbi:MAG TPA: L-erythro-3,5-diaminohexanoate dehydrogenase [Polyangiaceae bacterium]|nr:L-erythro-3,5-diaminohexanoate dehydrogenase [Polyangiaceae bacterium]